MDWELNNKKSWALKNWCLQTVVLADSCLDSKEIKSVNPKRNQPWIFTGRTDAEAEVLIHWPPDAKNWLNWKGPDAGKDWRWEEKGTTEDEMVGWHHRFDGHEFEQALGVDEGQGSLACCSPWGREELDMLNDWTDNYRIKWLKNSAMPRLQNITNQKVKWKEWYNKIFSEF